MPARGSSRTAGRGPGQAFQRGCNCHRRSGRRRGWRRGSAPTLPGRSSGTSRRAAPRTAQRWRGSTPKPRRLRRSAAAAWTGIRGRSSPSRTPAPQGCPRSGWRRWSAAGGSSHWRRWWCSSSCWLSTWQYMLGQICCTVAQFRTGLAGSLGSPTRNPQPVTPGEISDPRPATPSDPGRQAQPGSQRLTYIVWVMNAL